MLRDEQGATAIEYGLIAGLIVIAMVGGLRLFAGEADSMFNRIETAVENAS
ncbi:MULTISPECIES: Flp family type IVb pilin [Alteraurantiacibacter]|uniref:Flp family type IVb pilin n=2 Tax=Alteraurantiacibacter TaxID=2800678 RepID=A0ABV7EDI8_9SPHN